MSDFVRHEACPECGSSDNLGVFSDGHKFCFGCGYYESGDASIANYRSKYDTRKADVVNSTLPPDFDYDIQKEGLTWLSKYGLLQKEVINHRIGWSKEGIYFKNKEIQVNPLLVFPIYGAEGQLLMWQGRNFGTVGPKYITRGAKDIYHILGDTTKTDVLILTEDLISAIKVSRICPAMPLWGSYLSAGIAKTLSERFDKVILWLDKDKAQEAVKMASNLSYLFKEGCSGFRTERDPKEYLTTDILKMVETIRN